MALAAHVQLPINMVLKIDAMTFTRRTSPQSDVAYIYPVAVKAPLNTCYISNANIYVLTTCGVLKA